MASNSSLFKIIAAFVLVIVGTVLIQIIAIQTEDVTSPTIVVNESLNIASARLAGNNINTSKTFTLSNPGLQEAGGIVPNSIVITNATGQSLTGNFTATYTVYPDTIAFSNNTYMVSGGGLNNNTLVSYQYYGSDYIYSWAADVLDLISGFFAIALLGVGIALLYGILRDNKIV